MRGTSRGGEEGGGGGGGNGGHSPRGADAAEDPRHVARTHASPGESLLKIFAVARAEKRKKIRGRIRHGRGRQRKREEREGEFSYPAVLIWSSECDDTRRDATRRRASSVDPGAISCERGSDRTTLFLDHRPVVRDNGDTPIPPSASS